MTPPTRPPTGPAHPRHLGTVDAAERVERRVGRERIAPRDRGVAPLAGTPDVAEVQAGIQHAAVDDAGEERVELARDHGGHRLVEPGDPLADPADIDQQTPLRMDRHRRQVQIAELPADRRGAFGGLERRVEISGRLRGEAPRPSPRSRARRTAADPRRPAARAGATRPRSPCHRVKRARSRGAPRRSTIGCRPPPRSRRTRAGGGQATPRAHPPTSARRPPAQAQRGQDRAFGRSCRRQRYRSSPPTRIGGGARSRGRRPV